MQQRVLQPAVHVVGSHGEADLESFRGFAVLSRTCEDDNQRQVWHYRQNRVIYNQYVKN